MNRFENGFDSYQQAIVALENRSENEFNLKAVIIHFHHAIEVLFKHILYSKSKCLIYKDMNNWVNAAFDRKIGKQNAPGEAADYTSSFDEIVRRVIVVYEEQMDQYAYNEFLNLNKLRNALTHDEIELKIESVEQIIVTLTPIVTSILQKHLTGKEREKFDAFVTSEKYTRILKHLISYNTAWRITTISDLLELYSNRDYDSLSGNEIRHLESTISLLNVNIIEKGVLCNIDDKYYITYISYLKQEICDLLVNNLEEVKNNKGIINVIRRTGIIEKIIREYLIRATLYVYGLLNNQLYISFEKQAVIHNILDNNSFVNNHDIYVLLGCINRIIGVLVVITGAKRRKELLEKTYLDESKENSVELINSTLISWFNENGWFNSININGLDENIRDEIESDRVLAEVETQIWYNELYQELIGEFGEWSTIDRIDDFNISQPETIVKSNHEIILVFPVSFFTQTYSDHEYYDNGSVDCFIKVVGHMKGSIFVMDETEYMGRDIGFRAFRFD